MSISAAIEPEAQPAQLSQTLLPRHVSMIAIGGIIGAGLFVGSSATIAAAGPAAVLSYLIAGLLILLVMRMIAEMAVSLDGVQSFPDFARAGLGHLAGFLSGWLYWYFWVVVVAVEAIAGAKIIAGWLPGAPEWAIGTTLMTLMLGANLLSTRSFGEFEFWFSSIIVFILLGVAWVAGFTAPQGASIANLTVHGGFAPHGWSVVLAAVASTIFALCGAEIATIAAAESPDPAKVISRMTLSVTVRIVIFYVLSMLLIVTIVPWQTIVPGHSPFATTLAAMAIPGGETIMSAVVLVAVLSCLNSGLYVTSRALFGLARYGDAPRWLVHVNDRKVPSRAIIAASLFGYGALAANWLSPGTVFSFLVNSSGVTMILLYLLVAAAQLRLRTRFEREAPARLKLKMWFHPYGSLLAMAAMLAVLLFMALQPDLASQFWLSLLVAAGFAVGFAVRMRRA
jgi:GABA permease